MVGGQSQRIVTTIEAHHPAPGPRGGSRCLAACSVSPTEQAAVDLLSCQLRRLSKRLSTRRPLPLPPRTSSGVNTGGVAAPGTGPHHLKLRLASGGWRRRALDEFAGHIAPTSGEMGRHVADRRPAHTARGIVPSQTATHQMITRVETIATQGGEIAPTRIAQGSIRPRTTAGETDLQRCAADDVPRSAGRALRHAP